jgi:RHS repeat-associated protein
LTNASGALTKTYRYDAFGNEANPVPTDPNPFRYAGEYLDLETNTYYLRARNYDPATSRMLSEDTHWNPGNMIYGDYPVRINERIDPLDLTAYTYVPDINAIKQSANLYVYCGNNPVMYVDRDGEIFMLVTGAAGAIIGGVSGGIYSYAKYGEVRWQNVAGGAAIGGAIGLTGGAAAAVITTGSATASTTLVGIGAAKIASGAATAGTAVATRVIGSYPEYVAKAKDVSARFFQVPTNIWNQMSSAEQWAANQKFLDRAINQGAHFVLESSKKVAEYGPYLQKEIEYLLEHGYKFVESGTKLIPK